MLHACIFGREVWRAPVTAVFGKPGGTVAGTQSQPKNLPKSFYRVNCSSKASSCLPQKAGAVMWEQIQAEHVLCAHFGRDMWKNQNVPVSASDSLGGFPDFANPAS